MDISMNFINTNKNLGLSTQHAFVTLCPMV